MIVKSMSAGFINSMTRQVPLLDDASLFHVKVLVDNELLKRGMLYG